MYTDACEATHVRGEQSAEVLDLRMACLNERLGNARALSDVFATADGKVVENAVSAAAALPSLDRCADVPLLRAVVKPPEDPRHAQAGRRPAAELAQLVALRDSGQCARAIPKADALIADVSRGGLPAAAGRHAVRGRRRSACNCGDVAEMLQRFKEAHAAASASHNDDVAAQASALIPPFAINRLGQTVGRAGVAGGRPAETSRGSATRPWPTRCWPRRRACWRCRSAPTIARWPPRIARSPSRAGCWARTIR